MTSYRKTALYIFIVVFFVALDRFLKSYAIICSSEFSLVGDYLQFNFVKNYYIAFSIPFSGALLNTVIGIMIAMLIVWFVKLYKEKKDLQSFFVLCIMMGASSNLFDRLYYGFVIDYIDIKYFSVLNVADVMITLSAIALMSVIIKEEKNKKALN